MRHRVERSFTRDAVIAASGGIATTHDYNTKWVRASRWTRLDAN